MSIQDITIVITSFKSDEKIKDCLNSINSKCKVLLIENSNNIEFKKSIEKEFTKVECILTGENLGYWKANNIGLKKVTSKYALILNPDTFLETSTLDEFFKICKESDKHIMCNNCIIKLIDSRCPLCRKKINIDMCDDIRNSLNNIQ